MQLLVRQGDEQMVASAAGGRLDGVLLAAGVALERRCGGDASCGGCAIVLEEGAFEVEGRAVVVTRDAPVHALACRTRLMGPAAARACAGVVRVPPRASLADTAGIDDEFLLPPTRGDAAVRRLRIDLPRAGLEEPRSELERALDAARQALAGEPVQATLQATRRLNRLRDAGEGPLLAELMLRGERWELVDVNRPPAGAGVYGIALDIGTTTVVALLVDLEHARVIGKAARYNQQVAVAADVASRISAARTEADLRRLQRLLVADTLQPLLDELCAAHGIACEAVRRFSVAGNTVMTHLLLGLQVRSLGRMPFRPTVRQPQPVAALQLGLRAHPQALVEVAPAIAGYIGGDIVADMIACDLAAQPDGTLLVDIGTNAEIVLKDGGGMVCCATPAGPAFEGGGLLHGCRAAPGAIAHVRSPRPLAFALEVIGGQAPLGICGSAVIDLLAIGRRDGWMDAAGRFDIERLRRQGCHAEVEVRGRRSHACVLTPADASGRPVVLSEADVAELLQARSAVAAGWRTLLELRGRAVDDVRKVVLAGGFARRIDLEHAMAIGLLPRLPGERFEVIGNGALAGACMALLDRRIAQRMEALHRLPQVVELNLVPAFEGHFIDSLRLPEPQREAAPAGAAS